MDIQYYAAGVRRAAVAIGAQLNAMRDATPRQAYPHKALVSCLPPAIDFVAQADSYIGELAGTQSEDVKRALRLTARQLANLYSAATVLRSTIEWSSNFTAIDWWIEKRRNDLALQNKRVLIAPTGLERFRIERISEFSRHLMALGTNLGMLTDESGAMHPNFAAYAKSMRDFHVLYVPTFDGISPLWHPCFLGHEIAHLKYSDDEILKWLTSARKHCDNDLAKEAVTFARDDRFTHPGWMKRLVAWLVELACDSAAFYIYGESFLSATQATLAAHFEDGPTESHPPIEFRVALQRVESVTVLTPEFAPTHPHADSMTETTSALLCLAIPLRDHVRGELSSLQLIDDEVSSTVASTTADALDKCELPAFGRLSVDLTRHATSVESGLVRGLWRRRDASQSSPRQPIDHDRLSTDVDKISQVIDALEFATRFDIAKQQYPDAGATPTNVLWVSHSGISPDGPNPGPASVDLRLGRYFVIFQRNAVASLDSLPSPDDPIPPIQRSYEVGWGERFVLHPGELVLAVTFESLCVANDCAAQVLSRSSLGRLGLLPATAIHVHPGFVGCLTLELANLASVPLTLRPGQRIAQLIASIPAGHQVHYAGKYQDAGRHPVFSQAATDEDAPVLRALLED